MGMLNKNKEREKQHQFGLRNQTARGHDVVGRSSVPDGFSGFVFSPLAHVVEKENMIWT